jgi:hypothetical protein
MYGMMTTVDWTPLISTVAGAAIAISGTVIADVLRRRDNRHRYSYGDRQRAYAEMVLALGAGLEALRNVDTATASPERLLVTSSAAISKAGVYVAREKVLMSGAPKVVEAAEAAFDALIGVRRAVRDGAALRSIEYHDAYHPYEERMWRLRLAIRDDLNVSSLSTHDLDRADWSGRATCNVCTPPAPPIPAPARGLVGEAN